MAVKAKRCSKCGEEKPLTGFSRCRRNKDGYSHWCKACYRADYVAKKPERLAKQREYREPRRAELAAKSRLYRERHHAQSVQRNKEWKRRNPDRVRLHALSYIDRVRGGGGLDLDYAAILRRDPCSYCGASTGTAPMEIDHIDPVSKGGTGSWGNLSAACGRCNKKKSNLPMLLFLLRT